MNRIHLHQVCPTIFQHSENHSSDIWNQDIIFEKGKVYLIEAMSGTGKSSLCSYLCGYRNDFSGDILFDETSTHSLGVREWSEIRTSHISHLIQDLRLFPELTAFENIEIKNKITHHKTREEILKWLQRLGLSEKINTPVGRMSFGQQQRVAFLRALAQPFDFILTDEPISHLDNENSQLMGDLLLEEASTQGAGIICTSIGRHLNIHYNQTFKL